tara:strand:+ start:256 stop:438 length:183 start_codon:yes stop_codon:yes gene_type:complete
MLNIEARIKLEEMFKSLSTLRDTQDYYIRAGDDLMDVETRDELDACLLEIKEIKNLLMEK